MVVGIDVHKRSHVAALLDERGGELGTLSFTNSPEGMRKLRAWLLEHDAGEAVVGVESPAGYGRLLVASLEAAGHEVLNVPAWRTHRERHRHGPGKTNPGDAIAVAQVVLRKRSELGPALEPELVRALALLELQRRRLVRDRTQAVQRLRADWNQVDPVGEARVVNLTRERELRRLKRISFGDGLVEQVAARCIRDLARDIEDLNQRITSLETEIAQLLAAHGNPVADLHGAGPQIAAAVIAHASDVRRFRYHSPARGPSARASASRDGVHVTYAIIKVAGKQYRVREGERLLVDRLAEEDGATFTPTVLLVGGNGEAVLDPGDLKVTAKVLGAVKGPKIRIGKYKKRTGYRRHTGFRASLTQIEIESIGAKKARAAAKKQEPAGRESEGFCQSSAEGGSGGRAGASGERHACRLREFDRRSDQGDRVRVE